MRYLVAAITIATTEPTIAHVRPLGDLVRAEQEHMMSIATPLACPSRSALLRSGGPPREVAGGCSAPMWLLVGVGFRRGRYGADRWGSWS